MPTQSADKRMTMSSKHQLLDTILSTLGRDDGLRRAYLQQRWQGLAETPHQSASSRIACTWHETARAATVYDVNPAPAPGSGRSGNC
jgi:hypothetical protein